MSESVNESVSALLDRFLRSSGPVRCEPVWSGGFRARIFSGNIHAYGYGDTPTNAVNDAIASAAATVAERHAAEVARNKKTETAEDPRDARIRELEQALGEQRAEALSAAGMIEYLRAKLKDALASIGGE